jgi:hypothetical protein
MLFAHTLTQAGQVHGLALDFFAQNARKCFFGIHFEFLKFKKYFFLK